MSEFEFYIGVLFGKYRFNRYWHRIGSVSAYIPHAWESLMEIAILMTELNERIQYLYIYIFVST